jgi:hypothetical protein
LQWRPEFVAEAEKTRMTLNPIPGTTLHNMIVEGLSMPAAQRKAPANPCSEVLVGEPVAISESVPSWDYRR